MALFWGRLPSPVCYIEWVSCAGLFLLQALYGEVCGFSALAPPLAGVSPFLHQELSLDVVISFHPVLRALLCSFRVSSPSRAVRPPSWALAVFLRQLPSSSFASLRSTPLRSLVKMVLFFVTLATAIPIGELQALSVVFPSSEVTPVCHLSLLLLPSVSRSFLVVSLSDFAAGLDVCPLLCPVRALRIFLDRTASVQCRPCRLFVSLRCPSLALSVAALSFLLRVVFMRPVLPDLRLAPFAHMSSVASPPL